MSIEFQNETLCTITEATKIFPGRPHVATVWRWVNNGVRGLRLETIKVGGRRFTSHEAIERFIERNTAAADGREIPVRSARQRARDIARAEAELAAAGI